MKFSIFTPTHDLSRIDTPFQSLLNQSFKDFEWVILLNGKALEQEEELLTSVQASELNLKSPPNKVISIPANSSGFPTIILPNLNENRSAAPDEEIPK